MYFELYFVPYVSSGLEVWLSIGIYLQLLFISTYSVGPLWIHSKACVFFCFARVGLYHISSGNGLMMAGKTAETCSQDMS
jgi:hypothetical protein